MQGNNFVVRNSSDLIVLALSAVFVMFFFGDIVLHPSDYMFNTMGDGIKNYFTPAWYMDHNESWIIFEGMNFPKGDLFLYSDGHPALSLVMRILGVSGAEAVGVINFLFVFSLFIAPFFVCRSMRLLGCPNTTAVTGAIAICALAPQIGRFAGHYSLSYVVAIPLAIWMFLRFIKAEKKWGWSILIFITSLWWMFTHPYLGLMVAMFLLVAHVSCWIVEKKQASWFNRISHITLQGLGAIFLMNVFVRLIDQQTDRPGEPWGFWEFQASLKSVFVPNKGSIFNLLRAPLELDKIAWETKAYVGLVVAIGLLVMLVHWLKKRRQFSRQFEINPLYLLLPGFVVLLFAFGIPFRWIPSTADWVPFVKNFRVLARFSWVFYFTAGIVVFIWLGICFEANTIRKTWTKVLPLFFAAFMF